MYDLMKLGQNPLSQMDFYLQKTSINLARLSCVSVGMTSPQKEVENKGILPQHGT